MENYKIIKSEAEYEKVLARIEEMQNGGIKTPYQWEVTKQGETVYDGAKSLRGLFW